MTTTTHDFWSMGGYAAYVWSSYGVGFAVLAWNVVVPRLQRARVLRELREDEEAEA